MNLRQARKIHRRHADQFGWPDSNYTMRQLSGASSRVRMAVSLERKLACPFCGRQRFRPSDAQRPCTYEECPSHTHDTPHPDAKLVSGRIS